MIPSVKSTIDYDSNKIILFNEKFVRFSVKKMIYYVLV